MSAKRGQASSLRRKWQPWEEVTLTKQYATTQTAELARLFERTESAVHMKAVKLGLTKDPAFLQQLRHRNTREPWNKGKGGYTVGGPRKPRKRPEPKAAAYYDGMTVTKTHHKGGTWRYLRLSPGKWVLSHRYNWEQLHGPIPAGCVLRCLGEDSTNDDPANWELVTRRQLANGNNIGTSDNPVRRLTHGVLVATLSRGRPELRPLLREQPALLEAQRLRLTLNRQLQQLTQHGNSPF